MPIYFRKSVSAGPFRFNFSKKGMGLSVGVKGFRIGVGPRGHYIHAGRGGIYYRASLGKAGEKKPHIIEPKVVNEDSYSFEDAEMKEIESGDVFEMKPEKHQELIDELNSNSEKMKMSLWIAIVCAILGVCIFSFAKPNFMLLGVVLSVPGYYAGLWLDSYLRSSVLFFDTDEDFRTNYLGFVSSFENLSNCGGKWHISEKGDIVSLDAQKRNAGAASLVARKLTKLVFALPSVIKSNVTPPMIGVGRQNLYFFPDVLLVEDGKKYGAISYCDLFLEVEDSRFIEHGSIPHDAEIVDYTWEYVNKNGKPDRRFANNRQLPICLYESLSLSSNSGLNELLEFSKQGSAEDFAIKLNSLGQKFLE